jgi:D-glycero-alpha-D-manno-heptose 1-phosphate guanylyltransferase
VTIALKHMSDSGRYGSIEIDEFKNIVKFVEKQTSKNGYINGGIYILNTSIFLKFSTPEVFSFEDFLEEAFKS